MSTPLLFWLIFACTFTAVSCVLVAWSRRHTDPVLRDLRSRVSRDVRWGLEDKDAA